MLGFFFIKTQIIKVLGQFKVNFNFFFFVCVNSIHIIFDDTLIYYLK